MNHGLPSAAKAATKNEADSEGRPIEGTGFLAPIVLAEKCVGCGLCQMACHRVNVRQEGLLQESAIIIEAGAGKEDRLMAGSYLQLRQEEARQRQASRRGTISQEKPAGGDVTPPSSSDDPFGTAPATEAPLEDKNEPAA
jgi:hypothetical protein